MIRLIVPTLLGVALAAASLAPAGAQGIPPGSYQQSCSRIHVRDGTLIAHCTANQGAQIRSTFPLGSCRGDIANNNGRLVCNGGGYGNRRGGGMGFGGPPPGSYRQSCRSIQMQGSRLIAACPTPNGDMVFTSIDTRACRGRDIANRNGRLSCS